MMLTTSNGSANAGRHGRLPSDVFADVGVVTEGPVLFTTTTVLLSRAPNTLWPSHIIWNIGLYVPFSPGAGIVKVNVSDCPGLMTLPIRMVWFARVRPNFAASPE